MQDNDGVIYSTYFANRYICYDPSDGKATTHFFRTSDYPVEYMSRDILKQDDALWLLTAWEILKIDDDGNQSTIFASSHDGPMLNKFFKDRSGHLWITSEQGVSVFDENANRIQFYSLSEFDDNARIYPGRLAYDENTNSILLAHSAGIANKRLYRIPLDKKRSADYIQTEHATWGVASDIKTEYGFPEVDSCMN